MYWYIGGAALCFLTIRRYGFTGEALVGCAFAVFLLVLSRIDLKERLLPDRIVLPGLALFFCLRLVVHPVYSVVEYLIGMTISFCMFWLIAIITKGGIGGGDIKLNAVVGLLLGPYLLILSFPLFIIFGVITFLILAKSRKDSVPIGPAISASAIVTYLYGVDILKFYHYIMVN